MRAHRYLPVVTVAAGLGIAGCGGGDNKTTTSAASTPATTPPTTAAPAAPPSATIVTTLAEYTVTPKPKVGKAGQVTFNVTNRGKLPHEMVVVKTTKPADGLLKGGEADESGAVGEVEELAPGKSGSLKVKLNAGHYVLLCNLPGHYAAGQRVDFNVQ